MCFTDEKMLEIATAMLTIAGAVGIMLALMVGAFAMWRGRGQPGCES